MAAEPLIDLSTDYHLDRLATGVILLDAHLHIRELNLSAEILLEVSASRALGSPLEELLDESNEWYPLLHQALADNYPMVRRAIPLTTRMGQERTVDLTLSPIAGKVDSRCLLVELTMIDRLQAISRDESEWQAQATLKEIMKGVAHEVKNPLGGIRGAAQLLERELPSAALSEYTGVIIAEADRLKDLVDRMLGPHQRPNIEAVYLPEICEHVIAVAASEFSDRIEWLRDYDPSLPDIAGDRDQIIQAVLNVVRNACQALINTNAAKITLQTRITRQFTIGKIRHRQVMCLNIIDNGPGIDSRDLERIFYPMISGRPDGSGLGLSITQHIIGEHNGVIQVSSTFGQTIFSIFLPFEQPAEEAGQQERK